MLHRRTKIIGGITILLFVGSFGVCAGFVYLIAAEEEALHEQKIEIAKNHAYERGLASLDRLIEESEGEREEIASYIMEEEGVIDLLELLETLRVEQNVELTTTGLSVTPLDNGFEELKINITVSGSYGSVLHVLSLLETLPYQSYVADASLSEGLGGSGTQWRGAFTLHVTKYVSS